MRFKYKGFTLVEIMIVVAIIAMLTAIAVPSYLRSRMRTQAAQIKKECSLLDAAKDEYAIENNKTSDATPVFADLTPYLKASTTLINNNGNDILGNPFTIGDVSTEVRVNTATKDLLSETIGGDTFWGPYS